MPLESLRISSGPVVLRPFGPADEEQALAAQAELAADGFSFLFGWDPPLGRDVTLGWDGWLDWVGACHLGVQPTAPDGTALVPSTFLAVEVDGRLVGRVSVRHHLDDYLAEFGGHVGYAVRPQFRRRGYATAVLQGAVSLARDLVDGDRLLVTCDASVPSSVGVVAACGGVPDGDRLDPRDGRTKRRFFVDMSPPPGAPASSALADLRALARSGEWEGALATARAFVPDPSVPAPAVAQQLEARCVEAWCLGRLGRTTEAFELSGDTWRRASVALGETHPVALTALNHRARFASRLGMHREALADGVQVLRLRQRTLGDTHRDTLVSATNLVRFRLAEGAVVFPHDMEQLLDRWHRVDPERRELGHLAAMCLELEVRRRALVQDACSVLERYRAALGPDHPDTLRAAVRLEGLLPDDAGGLSDDLPDEVPDDLGGLPPA